MKANQVYFFRNRGPWDWEVRLRIVSWSALWRARIPLFSKTSLSMLILVQRLTGPLTMWTYVDYQEGAASVRHVTKMKKWALTVYRSEKTFLLEPDGRGVRLEGKEYYWPLSFIGIPFAPTGGSVDASTTRASYQMPMAGTRCDCRAILEAPEGYIDVTSPWIEGRFSLTDASNRVLCDRISEPARP